MLRKSVLTRNLRTITNIWCYQFKAGICIYGEVASTNSVLHQDIFNLSKSQFGQLLFDIVSSTHKALIDDLVRGKRCHWKK